MVKRKITIIGGLLAISITLSACSESMKRDMKDMSSEYSGGLNRTVDVYQNGKAIKHYEGKFDIKKTAGKIKFIDEKGKSHIIYFTGDTAVFTDEK